MMQSVYDVIVVCEEVYDVIVVCEEVYDVIVVCEEEVYDVIVVCEEVYDVIVVCEEVRVLCRRPTGQRQCDGAAVTMVKVEKGSRKASWRGLWATCGEGWSGTRRCRRA